MRDPIEVNYVPEGEDWLVTATGRGQTLQGKAPGLIAARDRADQLVEKLAPDEEHRTVVHLLNGDALAFTSAYLSARLAKPTDTPISDPPTSEKATEKATEEPAEKPSEENPEAQTPKAAETPPDSPTVPSPTPNSDQAERASTS